MRFWAIAAIACLFACRQVELRIDPDEPTNAKPYADPGTGGVFRVGMTVPVDGSGSFDPDGAIQSYAWRFAEQPMGSASSLIGADTVAASFTPNAAGNYVVELTVTDDQGAEAASRLIVRVVGPMLTVMAGADQNVVWHSTVQLAGTVTVESGYTYTVEWALISAPSGSTAALSSTATEATSFVPDREGDYVVRFTARTPYNLAFDDVKISATVPRQMLEYIVADAEYSVALDRFVIASDVPPKLRLHNPATNTEVSVNLPDAPVSVSLAPNGLRAAVAHTGSVSIVNLQTMAVEATHTSPIMLGEAVLGSSRVYLFHAYFAFNPIYTIDLTSGTLTESDDRGVYGQTKVRMHPNGVVMYGATTALSPEDIERYDASAAPATFTRDSPYHGQYTMGGDLWMTQDGNSIITRAGNVFYTSSNPAVDMTYRGTLGIGDRNWVAHSSALGKLAAVETEYDAWSNPYQFFLRVYGDQQLMQQRSEQLPDTPYNNVTHSSAGRYVAYNASSTKLYVIAKVGLGAVHVLYTYEP